MMDAMVKNLIRSWFKGHGAGVFVLVDGQYGSTGKGLIAGAVAEAAHDLIDVSVSNAGPNSGHTAYHQGEKIVLRQLPMFGVVARREVQADGRPFPVIYLTAGSVIDRVILEEERRLYARTGVVVHPHAAVIDKGCVDTDQTNVNSIASTGKGVGPAMQHKMARSLEAIYDPGIRYTRNPGSRSGLIYQGQGRWFYEVPQGFSLGINSGFYPYTTTRECTVSQALADAGIAPRHHRATIMSVRTYPIRVGNVGEASSGPGYSDQVETTWSSLSGALGQTIEPERTTVTNRERRIFTWSRSQFHDACLANDPDIIFVNFMNYLKRDRWERFMQEEVVGPASFITGRAPIVLCCEGPMSKDIWVWGGHR